MNNDIFEDLYSNNNHYLKVRTLEETLEEGDVISEENTILQLVPKEINNGMYEYNKLNLNR